MHITKLSIKNFRNFGDPPFEIDLKPFTLVLGENNVGKTNLLSAISLVFSQEISVDRRRGLELEDVNYDAVVAFKRQVADAQCDSEKVEFPEVVIDALLTGMNEAQHDVIGDWYVGTDLTQAKITYRFEPRSNFDGAKWVARQREVLQEFRDESDGAIAETELWQRVDFPIGEYRHSIYGGGQPPNECDMYLFRMLRVEVLDALRDAESQLMAGGENRLLYRVLRQGSATRYADLKEHLLLLEEAVRGNEALGEIKDDVATLLERVSLVTATEDNSIDFLFSAPDAGELLKKIGMVYGGTPISVARNGLGRNNLLYLALVLSQLAKAADTSPDNDDYICFRLVGIEEPEAHLHPHLQDHLASNIEKLRDEQSDLLQLLLTSHSTHVAAKLDLQNTVVLFQDEGTGRLACHYILDGIDPAKEQDAVRFLRLYLDATKARMLFARRLILVEGIAEQTIIPVLFEQSAGRTLESIGCTVLNVQGVAFRNFLTVVRNGFYKKCVVLTDRDTGKKTADRAATLKKDFEDKKLIRVQITDDSTFEKDLVAANRAGQGKDVLLEALTATKPENGPKFRNETGRGKIDVAEFYEEIATYKAEFAFNLVTQLQTGNGRLKVPKYIADAFDFIDDK